MQQVYPKWRGAWKVFDKKGQIYFQIINFALFCDSDVGVPSGPSQPIKNHFFVFEKCKKNPGIDLSKVVCNFH